MSKKKNHIAIPFDVALETCSKGSQQKVIWTCPKCKESGVRLFKSALKIKLCKICRGRQQVSSFSMKGENNPWFGKIPPCVKSGSEHPQWKGGKQACLDCGKQVKDYRSKYCGACFQLGERNTQYNPELTQQHRDFHRTGYKPHIDWAREVKVRDSFTCQKCKIKGGKLHSHHLNCWADYPEDRYDVENGVTLCKTCHFALHKSCGMKANKQQSLDYLVA